MGIWIKSRWCMDTILMFNVHKDSLQYSKFITVYFLFILHSVYCNNTICGIIVDTNHNLTKISVCLHIRCISSGGMIFPQVFSATLFNTYTKLHPIKNEYGVIWDEITYFVSNDYVKFRSQIENHKQLRKTKNVLNKTSASFSEWNVR